MKNTITPISAKNTENTYNLPSGSRFVSGFFVEIISNADCAEVKNIYIVTISTEDIDFMRKIILNV
ncbi:hypothetical protein [Butyrivibrio sp. XPD2006]|uniref:hypothetical protein n=1 Tax=Butyrivibrio sp. XPD2006 TaxID=1280668 RepID=UPI0003B5DE07|nr:hypothetical protein [Butyrivibrio sp. XPD2006]